MLDDDTNTTGGSNTGSNTGAGASHRPLTDALQRLATPTCRRTRAPQTGQPSPVVASVVTAEADPAFIGAGVNPTVTVPVPTSQPIPTAPAASTPRAALPRPAGTGPAPAAGQATHRTSDSGGGWDGDRDADKAGTEAIDAFTDSLDWGLIRALRQESARRLTEELERRPGLTPQAQEEVGRAVIAQVLHLHADSAIGTGDDAFTPAQERKVAKALFDQLYRAGRLQPLLDIPRVENIRIQGHDNVHVQIAGGDWQPAPPVAESDQELVETLQFLATRSGHTERAFTSSDPHLHMPLPGGARLAAANWISPRPVATIRIHRHTDVDLQDLVDLAMMDEALAQFLRACVRAGKSIIISGAQSAGKTTVLRSLANELSPFESIATIETEYELFLHEYPERHRLVLPLEARPGSGERRADGSRAGEVTLTDHLESSLRHSLSRIIVGECRGPEVGPMLQAMQAGAGAMSTVHAVNAAGAVQRLVTQLTSYMANANPSFALLQIASSIDVIVQLRTMRTASGGRYRYVSEVIELDGLADGASGRANTTQVFEPGPDLRAVPAHAPSWLADLEAEGFDRSWLTPGVGYWPDLDGLLGRGSPDQPTQQLIGQFSDRPTDRPTAPFEGQPTDQVSSLELGTPGNNDGTGGSSASLEDLQDLEGPLSGSWPRARAGRR
ncbi:CpaF family protein [Kineococcus sp. SYSU DK003]|uniref:CpaF family protein n=1 Tax=Kineococcus sp. SYSU DK003 TaxID=3383124 RepID=UPI003D7E78BD